MVGVITEPKPEQDRLLIEGRLEDGWRLRGLTGKASTPGQQDSLPDSD